MELAWRCTPCSYLRACNCGSMKRSVTRRRTASAVSSSISSTFAGCMQQSVDAHGTPWICQLTCRRSHSIFGDKLLSGQLSPCLAVRTSCQSGAARQSRNDSLKLSSARSKQTTDQESVQLQITTGRWLVTTCRLHPRCRRLHLKSRAVYRPWILRSAADWKRLPFRLLSIFLPAAVQRSTRMLPWCSIVSGSVR